MSDTLISRPAAPGAAWRLSVVALVLSFVAGLVAVSAAPVEGRNWTRQIAATRASQILHEMAMHSADREIRQLKKARKQTLRKMKKGRRNLERIKARRADVVAHYEALRAELDTAKAVLATMRQRTTTVSPPVTVLMRDVLGLSDLVGPPATDPALTASSILAAGAEGARPEGAQLAPVDLATLEDEVAALKERVITKRKAAAKVGHKVHRLQRSLRARARAIGTIKRKRGAAIARREHAEAALGGYILSMSRLAQRRVAKKTKVRPGRNSGFTWPVRGRISQTFGCTGFYLSPPRGSCRHFHDGLDIVGYRGTPIRAAAVGVISYVGWNPWDQHGRAFLVVVAHPGGYETLYGHVLPKRRVRVGQVVKKGEVIAYMGNTGRSTGVHLHLEMRRGRTIVNPLAYL